MPSRTLLVICCGLAMFSVLTACDDDGGEPGATDTSMTVDTADDTTANDTTVDDTGSDDTTVDDTGSDDTGPGDTSGADTEMGDTGETDTAVTDTTDPDAMDVADGADADGADADDAVDMLDTIDMSMFEVVMEMEPNDGTTVTETNAIEPDQIMQGTVGVPADADIFALDTTPGQVYTITLTVPTGSELQPHLTVFDDGRGGSAAGEDYVRLALDTDGQGQARLSFLAMGEAGYLLVVRDDRNVNMGGVEPVGSAQHTYELTVVEDDPINFVAGTISMLPAVENGYLGDQGDLVLWTYNGTAGTDIKAEVRTDTSWDPRLYIYAQATGDWIARNDDRDSLNRDPLIDAPLTESGPMYLVIENVAPGTNSSLYYELVVQDPSP